jgi:hypothetical protein
MTCAGEVIHPSISGELDPLGLFRLGHPIRRAELQ